MVRLILASKSAARMTLLRNAGIPFEAMPAPVDERAIEAPLIAGGSPPAGIAVALAEAKAAAVSRMKPDAIVVGADQTLEADGERWNKPGSVVDARSQLKHLGGRSHALHSGVAVACAGTVTWHHLDSAHLTMRRLSEEFIDFYLAEAGDQALSSVGAYQIEGLGIQLFERIDGDFFTILGLPLLPLLAHLRAQGVIPS